MKMRSPLPTLGLTLALLLSTALPCAASDDDPARLLRSPEAEPARRYLHRRRITPESIEEFHLGFSPNRPAWILERGRAKGFGPKLLEAIGILARPATGGSPYDRFRGRLLFSIRDTQARPVGFGGRVLPETGTTSPAKYVNSPETPLFSKSSLLYGLDVARGPRARDAGEAGPGGSPGCGARSHQRAVPGGGGLPLLGARLPRAVPASHQARPHRVKLGGPVNVNVHDL